MIPHERIINEVNSYYDVDVREKTRKQHVCRARQIAMNLLWVFTPLRLKDIGDLFGQDHSSVVHSRDHVWDLCLHYPEIRKQVIEIEKLIE